MDVKFIVTTQKDKGTSRRLISQVNSHVATLKHARPKGLSKPSFNEVKRKISEDLSPGGQSSSYSLLFGQNVMIKWTPLDRSFAEETEHTVDSSFNLQKSLGYMSELNQQILSSIDPLVSLPVKLSPREQSLLQFWLMDGRRLVFNTSSNPEYCPALHTAKRMLEKSAVYVLVHIVTAEAILCQLRRKSDRVSPDFYLRRAQAYRAMNKKLDDVDASFHDKIADLIQLACLEFILGQPTLQARHIQALQTYIREIGGMSYIMSQGQELGTPTLSWDWYLSIELQLYLQTEVPVPNADMLDCVMNGFTASLRQVRAWVHARIMEASSSRHHLSGTISVTASGNTLPLGRDGSSFATLKNYLGWLVKSSLSSENQNISYSTKTGAFNFVNQFCLLQVKYDYNAAQSLNFLESVQRVIENSTQASHSDTTDSASLFSNTADENPEVWQYRLNSTAASCILCYLRYSQQFPWQADTEINYFDASAQAVRLLPLISWQTILRLAEQLAMCVYLVADLNESVMKRTVSMSECMNYFNDEEIEQLEHEIIGAWMSKRNSVRLPFLNSSSIEEDIDTPINIGGVS